MRDWRLPAMLMLAGLVVTMAVMAATKLSDGKIREGVEEAICEMYEMPAMKNLQTGEIYCVEGSYRATEMSPLYEMREGK